MNNKKIKELWNRKSELVKNKKAIIIGTSALVGVIALGSIGYIAANAGYKDVKKNDKEITKTDTSEKDAKTLLEKLKLVDITKLDDEAKNALEAKIKAIEDVINKKDYVNAKKEIELATKDVENKLNEIAKVEETKTEEEQKAEEEKKIEEEQNKEVAANNETNTSQNDSGSNTSSSGGGNNNSGSGNSNSGNGGGSSNPAPTPVPTPTPPVVEQPKPDPIPTPEPPKPVYPSVAEVKQRLISYGQGLGYTYNPALDGTGFNGGGTSQMWSSGLGGVADGATLFRGMEGTEFGITVEDLGTGYVRMVLWIV